MRVTGGLAGRDEDPRAAACLHAAGSNDGRAIAAVTRRARRERGATLRPGHDGGPLAADGVDEAGELEREGIGLGARSGGPAPPPARARSVPVPGVHPGRIRMNSPLPAARSREK